MKVYSRLPLIASALLGLIRPALATDESFSPRYQLDVGQQLTYRSTSTYKSKSGSSESKLDQTVWVVRRNDDGFLRLVVRTTSTDSHDISLEYFDLASDGTVVPNDSLDLRFDPTLIFPKLPKDADQVAKGWEDSRATGNSEGSSHFKVVNAGKGEGAWVFDEVRETPLDKVYGTSYKYRFTFDTHQGFLSRIEGEITRSYENAKSSDKTELVAVEKRDADWITKFAAGSDRFFAAKASYLDLIRRAEMERIDGKTMEADAAARSLAQTTHTPFKFADLSGSSLLAEAQEGLKKARDASALPMFRELIDVDVKQHSRMASASRKSAIRRARVVGKAAPEWELEDLEGKPHTLKDYRGKIVVLDFWYRGCGWCIRALPQVNQLVEEFKNQPVAFLGMSIDEDVRNAKFVAQAMELKYPVLKVKEGLQQEYNVQAYPTLVLIGPDGIVRNLHIGFSTNLREDVSQEIKKLLTSK
jgi:peroxiredoxin